jgi:hypothetical protein
VGGVEGGFVEEAGSGFGFGVYGIKVSLLDERQSVGGQEGGRTVWVEL